MATAPQAINKQETPGQIIERYQQEAPVDVMAIANSLGLTVWEDDIQPLSGKLFRDPLNGGGSGFSIVVNERESSERKRFTIAHEIAHFILHKDDLNENSIEETLYRGGLSGPKEVEANKLAAEILMPYSLIERLIKSGIHSLDGLAEALGVSKTAVAIRLGASYVD